jgi:hypothetical protein
MGFSRGNHLTRLVRTEYTFWVVTFKPMVKMGSVRVPCF